MMGVTPSEKTDMRSTARTATTIQVCQHPRVDARQRQAGTQPIDHECTQGNGESVHELQDGNRYHSLRSPAGTAEQSRVSSSRLCRALPARPPRRGRSSKAQNAACPGDRRPSRYSSRIISPSSKYRAKAAGCFPASKGASDSSASSLFSPADRRRSQAVRCARQGGSGEAEDKFRRLPGSCRQC